MPNTRQLLLVGMLCACASLGGCPNPTDTTNTTDVSQTALSFAGNLSGTAVTESRTDGDVDLDSARKYLARAQGTGGSAWITDLAGNRLLDVHGRPYGDFQLNPDGSFSFTGLPVGVDFMLNIDLDGDGSADLQTILHIPQDSGSEGGSLDNTLVDPLSTVAGAKLRQILDEYGADVNDLDVSASGMIGQTRQTYEGLYDFAGIFSQILFDEIAGMTPAELAAFFDQYVPEAARKGMGIFHGRVGLKFAKDAGAVAQAAARILLEGGLAIADHPGGVDFSGLAALPNVEVWTFDEYFAQTGYEEDYQEARVAVGGEAAFDVPETDILVYVNTQPELNRNWVHDDEGPDDHHGPMIGEHMLIKMAEAYLLGKTVSMEELYTIMTDIERGLGMRLTYTKFGGPHAPPVEVFQTTDGRGLEVNVWGPNGLMDEFMKFGVLDPSPEAWAVYESLVRQKLADFLSGTVPPTFEHLFDGLLMPRVPGPEEFARILHEQRVHVPWSLSGPSKMYVVATGDWFRDKTVTPVTVDVVTDATGGVTTVTYKPDGTGDYWVGFGPDTQSGMLVELIRRDNGKPLHTYDGAWIQLEMSDGALFQPVNGESFYERFSETDTMWPVAPALQFPNYAYDPTQPENPDTNPRFFEAWVLMNRYGPGATPVQVNYNPASGTAAVSANGQYYLLSDEDTWDDDLFTLISTDGSPLELTPGDWSSRVRTDPATITGLGLTQQSHTWVYGTEVANPAYDPAGAPYWDDINGNGGEDAGEPLFSEQYWLDDPDDWRSTWVEQYYRRADNHGYPDPQDIDWEADTPQLQDGTPLVPRTLKPRLNGYKFGRPGVTVNLMLAFSPPDFFNGTHALDVQTRVNPFMVIAMVHLVFESMQTVEAVVDWDGPGGFPEHVERVPAYWFTPPIGDPIHLIAEGFRYYAQ